MGINYLVLPALEINNETAHRFYGNLTAGGIDFTNFSPEGNQIKVQRKPPFPLEILVAGQISPAQPFGQLLILAPDPNRPLHVFSTDAEAVIAAVDQTWPSQNRQIVSCDVALRYLYPSTSEHAFREIWETRLCQPQDLINKLGRNVLGGGLRFVMPPQQSDPEPIKVEVKIESFLKDTKMIFIEALLAWPEPKPPRTPFDPTGRLNQADEYVTTHIHSFMESGT